MKFTGLWHIAEMEVWDEEYLNMEVQAYIRIDEDATGTFQFGNVVGEMDGEVASDRFEFTWAGDAELDPVSGSGWLRLIDEDTAEGHIKIHRGDSSSLQAVRAG